MCLCSCCPCPVIAKGSAIQAPNRPTTLMKTSSPRAFKPAIPHQRFNRAHEKGPVSVTRTAHQGSSAFLEAHQVHQTAGFARSLAILKQTARTSCRDARPASYRAVETTVSPQSARRRRQIRATRLGAASCLPPWALGRQQTTLALSSMDVCSGTESRTVRRWASSTDWPTTLGETVTTSC